MLQLTWFLLGVIASFTYLNLDRSSDYLGLVLPVSALAVSTLILLVGIKFSGLSFVRDMVVPAELGVVYLWHQPLPGMASISLVLGLWLGLANRLMAEPVTVTSLLGQSALILSPWLLLWRHCGANPMWALLGVTSYAVLSNRPKGRRILA